MKTKYILFILVSILSFYFIACENEEEDSVNPAISNLLVGHDDTIHAGEDVHIEFEVSDNESLDYYNIAIHPEDEHKSLSEHWSFDSTFTEISGLKNSTVHHHAIIVPENAEEGEYHFHLTVADKEGNTATEEKDLILTHEVHDEDHEEEDLDH